MKTLWSSLGLLLVWLMSHPATAKVLKDVPYGPDKRQRMDVYLPDAPSKAAANAPVIFMVHGGYWSRGDKNGEGIVRRKMMRWLPQGWVFVSTNYRLLPQAEAFAARAKSMQIRVKVLQQDLSHSKVNNRLGLPGVLTDTVEAFITSLDTKLTFTPQRP